MGNKITYHKKSKVYRMTVAIIIADKGFCRIHRSYAINVDHINSIKPLASGDAEVTLHSGKVLPVSRRYKDEIKNHLLSG